MQVKTQGLIIKEQTIGESDRLVTVLTRDEGVVRAFARKAKTMKDSKRSGTQLLCYSRLNLYVGRDKYIINDAMPIEVFFGLRGDITKLSLAQYFCELSAALIPEGVDGGAYLRVVLNALHFLSKGTRPEKLLKALVEMRMLSHAGFMPDFVGCTQCGVYEAPQFFFLPQAGCLCCSNCFHEGSQSAFQLGPAAVRGMRHMLYADMERLFSFQLSGNALREASEASEAYMYSVVQKKLQTLDFYHAVCEPA